MTRSEKNLSDKYDKTCPPPPTGLPQMEQNKQKQGYDSWLLRILK